MATDSQDLSKTSATAGRGTQDKTDPSPPRAPVPQIPDAHPSEDDVERSLSILMNPKASSRSVEFAQTEQQIGKYKVERILGCHGQATVILARDPDLSRRVVLKLYHKGVSGQHRQRIINEGRALARIHNPHVANCYGVEENAGCLVLVLEYVPGRPLDDWLQDCRPSIEERLQVIRQLATGLVPAHRRGLLHRDLKPSNVIVTPRGIAKLIDFGLVQSMEHEHLDASGTPAFLPPEVARDGEADERSDVFGLGAILYFMLTKRAPFQGFDSEESRALARTGDIPELSDSLAEHPSGVTDLCQRLLSKHVERRPLSMIAVIHQIDQLLADHKRRRWRILLTASPLIAIGIIAIWAALSFAFPEWLPTRSSPVSIPGTTASQPHTAFRVSSDAAASGHLGKPDLFYSSLREMPRLRLIEREVANALALGDLPKTKRALRRRIAAAKDFGLGTYLGKFDEQRLNYISQLERQAHPPRFVEHAVTLAKAELLLEDARAQLKYPCSAEELEKWIRVCERLAADLAGGLGDLHVETWRALNVLQRLHQENASEDLALDRLVHTRARSLFGSMSEATHASLFRLAANYWSKEGNPGAAEQMLDSGVQMASDGPAPARRWAAKFLRLRAKSLVGLPRPDEANHCLFHSREVLASLQDSESLRIDWMEQLGMESYILDLCGAEDDQALEAALNLVVQLDEQSLRWDEHAMRCVDIAFCFGRHDREQEAIEYLERAVELASSGYSGEIKGRARTLYKVLFRACAMARALQRPDLEESYVQEALALTRATQVGSIDQEIHLERVMSGLRFRRGDLVGAYEHLTASKTRFASLYHLSSSQKCVHLIAFSALHMQLGQPDEATRMATQALELAELAREKHDATSPSNAQWDTWAEHAQRILQHASRLSEVAQETP